MSVKLFLSWSGERSRKVAELLDEWVQCVIQACEPWMSSKNIDRGALWFTEISSQLHTSTIGVICLTKENREKPWILFEAGALAKGLSSNRVCTFLIDLEPTDVGNPLAQFNHTLPTKDGIYSLISTVNSSLGELRLKDQVIESVFETYWPQFESKFQDILSFTDDNTSSTPVRTENDMLSEILQTMRNIDRRVREIESVTNKDASVKPFDLSKEWDEFMNNRKLKVKVGDFIKFNAAVHDSDDSDNSVKII
ncbi:toll-Interleukin receptor [Candidatus Symbiopectobacterium sp. NZEC127]|uniref:toll-Interleukin receptor n=1 Tax=Candidatus Symbiopectobacterium sp. NZEC127 TaxID=2820472 RepID=UPI002226B0EB|nr:toll-Interleukin receptor [Candidatus Symbiopectobacterium sp. NZEC127]MCW2484826.1 toll-Interleukin receptor [Candidatus Symbiopectobacterium sp. NZEC127]